MWICGTGNKKLRQPSAADKAHGRGRGKGADFWLDLIHAAIGDGLLTLHFTTIRTTGLFRDQISATLVITEKGKEVVQRKLEWKSPCQTQQEERHSSKKNRSRSGSNIMSVIEGLMCCSEKWFEVRSVQQYNYPGVFSDPQGSSVNFDANSPHDPPRMGHVPNIQTLSHFTGLNYHLLYNYPRVTIMIMYKR